MWANIAVTKQTKHVLLVHEFIPYWPRLLGFHSLHVNAMKCIFVGFSLSKLQSFFWKISLNSRLIRLEGFNNKISTLLIVCSTWPSGKALACVSEVLSSIPGITFFSSFRLFFFCASFPLVFILGITVLLCFYCLQVLDLHFFPRLYLPFPRSLSRGPAVYTTVKIQFAFLLHSTVRISSSNVIFFKSTLCSASLSAVVDVRFASHEALPLKGICYVMS